MQPSDFGVLPKALRLAGRTPTLWLLVLLQSFIPSYSGPNETWLTCLLSPFLIAISSLATLGIPYVAHEAIRGRKTDAPSIWHTVKRLWPPLLGLYALLAIPLVLSALAWQALIRGAYPQPPAFWTIALVKYLLAPIAGAVVAFAISGISIHALNGFRALVNSLLICTNHLPQIALLGLMLSALSVIPQAVLLSMQSGHVEVARAITSLEAFSPAGLSALELSVWSILADVLYLPITVSVWGTWVVLYLSAVAKVPYPWLNPRAAA
jgi:hypothetical protein